MVHDYQPCPRDIQCKMLDWRIQASHHHIDVMFGHRRIESFYPSFIFPSAESFQKAALWDENKNGEFLFLMNGRLFASSDGSITELDANYLYPGKNDWELLSVLMTWTFQSLAFSQEEWEAVRRFYFRLFADVPLDLPRRLFSCDEKTDLKDFTFKREGDANDQNLMDFVRVFAELIKFIPELGYDLAIRRPHDWEDKNNDTSFFQTALATTRTLARSLNKSSSLMQAFEIQKWSSRNEFHESFQKVSETIYFIPEFHPGGWFDTWVREKSTLDQCFWYLNTQMDTLQKFGLWEENDDQNIDVEAIDLLTGKTVRLSLSIQ